VKGARPPVNRSLGLTVYCFAQRMTPSLCSVAMHFLSHPSRFSRTLLLLVGVAALATGLAGCQTTRGPETTGSIAPAARTEADWRRDLDGLAANYKKNPMNPPAAMAYARALRETDQRAQAAAVLEQAAIHHPQYKPLLGAYGRALADAGRYKEALAVLNNAHTPDAPDWHILSAEGAVLDQLGRHDEARRYYMTALAAAPNEPSVLSNLGLSYALSHDLKNAEATLRKAVALPGAKEKARQNLALVVGLQGRFDEADKIARADLPPDEAAANVAYLRDMLSRQPSSARTAQR
jgi:Flp pilus assembly protein TadD